MKLHVLAHQLQDLVHRQRTTIWHYSVKFYDSTKIQAAEFGYIPSPGGPALERR